MSFLSKLFRGNDQPPATEAPPAHADEKPDVEPAVEEEAEQPASDGAEKGDAFGASVEAGDFNGDGFADMAVGIRAEDVGTVGEAGAVAVLYGSPSGLVSSGSQLSG